MHRELLARIFDKAVAANVYHELTVFDADGYGKNQSFNGATTVEELIQQVKVRRS